MKITHLNQIPRCHCTACRSLKSRYSTSKASEIVGQVLDCMTVYGKPRCNRVELGEG